MLYYAGYYLVGFYLGYFGKSVVDGTAANDGGIQDILLLVALGFSVLIGVFASQLAGETWDAILAEEESEKNADGEGEEDEKNDGIVREVFGIELPLWMVGFQLSLQEADERMNTLIVQEIDAKVWNYTSSQGSNPIPREINPAFAPTSPEIVGSYKGIKVAESLCDGLVLSPNMFSYFLKVADPLFDEETFHEENSPEKSDLLSANAEAPQISAQITKGDLLNRLQVIRDKTVNRRDELEKRIVEN